MNTLWLYNRDVEVMGISKLLYFSKIFLRKQILENIKEFNNMRTISSSEIIENANSYLNLYLSYTNPEASRVYSYDVLREFFVKFHDTPDEYDEEIASAFLFAYLGSWGMLRGEKLRSVSFLALKKTIECIKEYWNTGNEIDIFSANNAHAIEDLIKIKNALLNALGADLQTSVDSLTLVSKILLGVWGICPALDSYFTKAFGYTYNNSKFEDIINCVCFQCQCLKERSIEDVHNQMEINKHSLNKKFYSKAKIVDMYGFYKGKLLSEEEKKNGKNK